MKVLAFFTLAICISHVIGLSCWPCPDDVKCKKLPKWCGKGVMPDPCFGCCPVCGREVFDFCTQKNPCAKPFVCEQLAYNPLLPWYYEGICLPQNWVKWFKKTYSHVYYINENYDQSKYDI